MHWHVRLRHKREADVGRVERAAAGVGDLEAVSVIVQVTYFRLTRHLTGRGKRYFKMAPIHHHFELKGWPETKIVIRFWIIGLLLALLSLTTFKVR